MPALTTSVLYDEDVAVLVLDGELDLADADRVDALVDQALVDGARLLVVDLERLSFCDSTGLGSLVRAAKRCAAAEATCVLAGAAGPVKRVFDVVLLERAVPLVPDVQTALHLHRTPAQDRRTV